MSAAEEIKSVKDLVSAEEWQLRIDLAATYRLVAMYGWDDMIFTHISVRVPGPEHHFLINPYGMLFEEITASSLVKVDLEGNIVMDSPYFVNPAGFTIHSAVHMAREDAQCVLHLHTDDGVAVSAQDDGLLPLSQFSMLVRPHLTYHGYEGVALNHDERERIVADLGDKNLDAAAQSRHFGGGRELRSGLYRDLFLGASLRNAGARLDIQAAYAEPRSH